MNQDALIKKIKSQATQDQKHRHDIRFVTTIGFLVAKGFLRTNFKVQALPNIRIKIDDAIWAGKNVEPRILEVLPAAVLRLEKHFDLDSTRHPKLARVVNQLKRNKTTGDEFENIAYSKLKVWAEFKLRDKRVKPVTEKKVMRSFRLDPLAIQKLKDLAREKKCSEAEAIENLLSATT